MDINSLIMDWARKSPEEKKAPSLVAESPKGTEAPPKPKKTKKEKEEPKEAQKPKVVEEPEEEAQAPSTFPPPGYVTPVVLKCGHMNFGHHGTKEDDPKQVDSRAGGFCCSAVAEAVDRHRKVDPEGKITPKPHVFWEVRGLYEPVPKSMRRTQEKDKGNGWPGLCCHPETGLYIGGLGNDCRYHHKGEVRCEVHSVKRRVEKTENNLPEEG